LKTTQAFVEHIFIPYNKDQMEKFAILENQNMVCVTTLALGLRPRQGLTRVRDKKGAREAHIILRAGECEGMNPHTPK